MSASRLLAAMALACFAAVGAALVAQHVYDMQPCPWCILQRLIFIAIGGFCLLGAAFAGRGGARPAAALALLLALAGSAAALWQHFVAAKSASCNLTLADRIVGGLGLDQALPDVFEARASCADAAAKLLGLPYEIWSLALFVALALAALRAFSAAQR